VKPIAKSAGRDHERWLRVALVELVLVGMELWIREECENPTTQTGEQ
jgi:hypothetical protein